MLATLGVIMLLRLERKWAVVSACAITFAGTVGLIGLGLAS